MHPPPSNRSLWQHVYQRGYVAWNYRLRTLAGGRWADHCRPTDIVFLMTNLCNARCVHCDIWKNRGKEDLPTLDEYRAVLDDLRRWLGPVPVAFSGGEALLRPYTTDAVAHGARIGLFTELLTHGYWDDQARIEKLALANPGRVTVSLDGIGETHTTIRGRAGFFEKTRQTLDTLLRVRRENRLGFRVRLKTVIMSYNLDDLAALARLAGQEGMEIFFQAVEQNYNTPEDPRWFESTPNWPRDTGRAVEAVRGLMALRREGLPIVNSPAQLEAMIPYFQDPDSMRVSMQSHTAHEGRPVCSALSYLQVMPNGDVLTCYGMPPVGNFRAAPIREIWSARPRWWRGGCCLERRCTPAEKEKIGLTPITPA